MGKALPSEQNLYNRRKMIAAIKTELLKRREKQADMAKRIGTTQARITRLLKEDAENFSLDALFAYADALGLSVTLRVA